MCPARSEDTDAVDKVVPGGRMRVPCVTVLREQVLTRMPVDVRIQHDVRVNGETEISAPVRNSLGSASVCSLSESSIPDP